MTDGLDPDAALCLVVAEQVLSRDRGTDSVTIHRLPERDRRNEPAVEIVVSDEKGDIALEHTTIEPFDGVFQANAIAAKVFGPNPLDVPGLDPNSTYQLSVRPHELTNLVGDWAAAGRTILRWVSERAPSLRLDDFRPTDRVARSAPGELPLTVTLSRGPTVEGSPLSGRLLVSFAAPDDREDLRQARLLRALKDKVPKLLTEGSRVTSTALVLETTDIYLTNDGLVLGALIAAADEYAGPLPDYIVLVATVGEKQMAWTLRSDETWHWDQPLTILRT